MGIGSESMSQGRVASVVEPITDAMSSIIRLFEAAIAGFLFETGVQIHER